MPYFVEAMLEDLSEALGAQQIAPLLQQLGDDIARHRQTWLDAWGGLDFDAVRRAAHTLKGSAGAMGAIGLSQACNAIEMAAARGNPAELVAAMQAAESVAQGCIAEAQQRVRLAVTP